MARTNLIKRIMHSTLPAKTYQRRLLYRPALDEIDYYYELLNKHIFAGELSSPIIYVGRIKNAWGECYWTDEEQETGSYCYMRISDKWYCPQWFLNVLAHEMVHQAVWDKYRWEHHRLYGREIYTGGNGHGPSFFAWRDDLAKHGLHLKKTYNQNRWFQYQDFLKC